MSKNTKLDHAKLQTTKEKAQDSRRFMRLTLNFFEELPTESDFETFRSCHAITWLVTKGGFSTRKEAERFLLRLLDNNLIQRLSSTLTQSRTFSDDESLYRVVPKTDRGSCELGAGAAL